jgi:hypothetical protein
MSEPLGSGRIAAEVGAAEAVVTAAESEDVGDGGEPRPPVSPDQRRWLIMRSQAAMLLTALLVLTVIILLPIAITSLVTQLRATGIAPAYDVLTGTPLDPGRQEVAPLDATYADFDISAIDEATRVATVVVSGNRLCAAVCPDVVITLSSLSAPGSLTRGMPPSATFDVPGQTGPISTTVKLPVAGDPQRYPFDTYTLLFGIAGQGKGPRGAEVPVTKERIATTTEITLSSSVGYLQMAPPVLLDPARPSAVNGSAHYLSVLRLAFTRPVYQQVLTIMLVLLITASGFFALFMRDLGDLSLGIGGIILGIWGIRSVVIQGDLPAVTIVDTVLAIVILVMLLGMAVRATLHFWRQAQTARRP